MEEAYIIAGSRTAIGKAGKGGFRNLRSDDMAVRVIQHLMASYPEITPDLIDDVIVGCANPEGEQGLQMGRQISLRAMGIDVPGMIINRYCASGLEAIAIASAKIRANQGECYIAGGAESMSFIPMTGYKLAPSYEVALDTPDYVVGMGLTAEAVASKFGISRDAADAFSVASHQKAAAAQDAGLFAKEILPIEVEEVWVQDNKRQTKTHTVLHDEGIRRETTLAGLAALKPAFATGGVVTAGNASQTSDGAAFVLVISSTLAKKLNLTPIARLMSCAVAGVEPILMGIGPCAAIPKALKKANLKITDINLVELNEAFAAQALAVIQEAGLDPTLVNVNGGAIALGHPLGCTGAKLTIQLLNELERRQQKYGLVTACVGGGQGIAGIFERF